MERICVFCGSSVGARPAYAAAARALGAALVARGLGLVYGGGNVGLMGVIADEVLAGGGEVVGVIPGHLAEKELAHAGATEMHVVGRLRQAGKRKDTLRKLPDRFLPLPQRLWPRQRQLCRGLVRLLTGNVCC